MYYIQKRLEISCAHRLDLNYESKCSNVHGHNWIINVYCESDTLNENGMVVDFTTIKQVVHGKLDHAYLNDVLDFNPTAERMAEWICNEIPFCYRVDVQESEGNTATYSRRPLNA